MTYGERTSSAWLPLPKTMNTAGDPVHRDALSRPTSSVERPAVRLWLIAIVVVGLAHRLAVFFAYLEDLRRLIAANPDWLTGCLCEYGRKVYDLASYRSRVGNRGACIPHCSMEIQNPARALRLLIALLSLSPAVAVDAEPLQAVVRCNPDTVILAAALGSMPTLEDCLSAGVSFDQRNVQGDTPLLAAVDKDQRQVARWLLEHGANPNLPDRNGNTPLIEAVRLNRPMPFELALEFGRLLHLLINKGADPNRQNARGETALMFAARIDNSDSVELLLSRGADPNVRANDGRTVLLELCEAFDREGKGRMKMLEILLKAGVDPNAGTTPTGATPLLSALEHGDDWVVYGLLKHAANVNTPDNLGTTPLHKAVQQGSDAIIRALIERGAAVNARDAGGETPIFGATAGWQVALLAAAGANIDAADENGTTALMRAAETGNEELLRALLKAGAKVNAVDNKGRTALRIAKDSEKLEVARLLQDSGGVVMVPAN